MRRRREDRARHRLDEAAASAHDVAPDEVRVIRLEVLRIKRRRLDDGIAEARRESLNLIDQALAHIKLRAKWHVAIRPHDVFALGRRSEEHTSELQSRGHLVCRLLLEKK